MAYKIIHILLQSLRRNIETHLQQYSVYHAQLQAQHSLTVMQELEKIKVSQHNHSERLVALEQQASHTESKLGSLDQRFGIPAADHRERSDQYTSKITILGKDVSQLKLCIEQLQRNSRGTGLMGSSTTYAADVHTGVSSSLGTATHTLHTAPTKQEFDALGEKVTELDHSLDRCLSSSLDQELRLQLLERTTYNGILLWKIDDFPRRRREAVDGVTLSLYSTPFYTSRHGYKMCARIYLNGDGLGKGTHLSFFFVIMRGLFDALLTWPFKQTVKLTLLNQVGKKHVTDQFRPEPQSSSFQRPGRKEMNIASGCPMFIRIEHLLNGGFVKDDSIFLCIVVDIADLPKIIP